MGKICNEHQRIINKIKNLNQTSNRNKLTLLFHREKKDKVYIFLTSQYLYNLDTSLGDPGVNYTIWENKYRSQRYSCFSRTVNELLPCLLICKDPNGNPLPKKYIYKETNYGSFGLNETENNESLFEEFIEQLADEVLNGTNGNESIGSDDTVAYPPPADWVPYVNESSEWWHSPVTSEWI